MHYGQPPKPRQRGPFQQSHQPAQQPARGPMVNIGVQGRANALWEGANAPSNSIGEGVGQLAHAYAYQKPMKEQGASAGDPWSGMRQTSGGTSLGDRFRGLFGMKG